MTQGADGNKVGYTETFGMGVGTRIADRMLSDPNIRALLENLKDMGNLLDMLKSLGEGLGIKEELGKILGQADGAMAQWTPTITELLNNLQNVNQSGLGRVLLEFKKAQTTLQEIENIKKKAEGHRAEEEKGEIGDQDQILKQVEDSLIQALDEKLARNNAEGATTNSTSFTTARSTQSPSRQEESESSAKVETVVENLSREHSAHDEKTTQTLEEARGKLELEQKKSLIEQLKAGVQGNLQNLLPFIAAGVKQLEGYEAKYSQFAQLVHKIRSTIEQGDSTLKKIDEACDGIKEGTSEIKGDLAHTTDELRADIRSISKDVGEVVGSMKVACNGLDKALSSFTGNPIPLTRGIDELDFLIQYISLKTTLNSEAIRALKIKDVDHSNASWLEGLFANCNDINEEAVGLSDEGKNDIKNYVARISLLIQVRQLSLSTDYTDQEIRETITRDFNECVAWLQKVATADDPLEYIKAAKLKLVKLQEERFNQLPKTIISVGNTSADFTNIAQNLVITCNNVNDAAYAGGKAANRFFPDGNKATYFALLGAGHISAIVAATLLYCQGPKILCNISLANPLVLIIGPCFAFSTIFLFFATKSDAKIMEDKNKSDILKLAIGTIPLLAVTVAGGIFAARLVPNLIPSCGLQFAGCPSESILVLASIGIFFTIVMLCAVGKLVFDRVSNIGAADKLQTTLVENNADHKARIY